MIFAQEHLVLQEEMARFLRMRKFFQILPIPFDHNPIVSFQQLDAIIESLQANNLLTRRDESFLQSHAERIRDKFLKGIISVLRSIYSYTLPPEGIHQVHRQIQALQLSLSLFENQLGRLEDKRNSGENLENLKMTTRISSDGTIRALEE